MRRVCLCKCSTAYWHPRLSLINHYQRQPQFDSYCPYCQTTRLPQLKQTDKTLTEAKPPPYTEIAQEQPAVIAESSTRAGPPALVRTDTQYAPQRTPPPPSYAEQQYETPPPEQDVTHYVRLTETISSISLSYNIDASLLKTRNRITADHLLQARRMIYIPCPPYYGPSLSPEPAEGFEESERKAKIRRFMIRTKCADQKMAEAYMRNADETLDRAVEQWNEDEDWMRRNPRRGDQHFSTWVRSQAET